MVAKISLGSSLYGALAYNGEKINKGQGKLLGTNKVSDGCSGNVEISRVMRDFSRYLSPHSRVEKPVMHVSLNPHPDDVLTDVDLENIAREYMEGMGYGGQPFMIFKHEDIDRHHLHIVALRTDGNGRCISDRYNFHRSKAVTRGLERKYGLHPADRRQQRSDNPLHKVDVSQGDVKRQVANTVKSLCATYKFQTMGEYRALLSLYNVMVEETRGIVHGREYHGLVYSATDDAGNKIGNPFNASKIGKSVGYEAIERRFLFSRKAIREKKLADMTKKTILSALSKTYHKEEFTALLKAKGVDVVFRHTAEGRIYGTTFIDHRTGCVLNGSRMGKDLSANALQEHFTLPYAGQMPIPLTVSRDVGVADTDAVQGTFGQHSGDGLGLLSGDEGSSFEAQEAAFDRELRRKKKKRPKGMGM